MSEFIQKCADRLELQERKKLTMTGVDSVDGFNEEVLNLTVSGSKMKVSGEGIKITAYNKNSGELCAEGLFNEIKFSKKSVPLLRKFFK